MKFEIVLNNNTIKKRNYSISDIHYTIKNELLKYDLLCMLEDEILSFQDRGREDDFANMWNIITSLMKSQWFLECTSSCIYYDDDGTIEDVLSQAWKFNKS